MKKKVFGIVAAGFIMLSLYGCDDIIKNFKGNSLESANSDMQRMAKLQGTANFTATKEDMLQVLNGSKGICSSRYSKYVYKSSGGMTDMVSASGPVTLNDAPNRNGFRASVSIPGLPTKEAFISYCGGSIDINGSKVTILPAVYYPSATFPHIPEGVIVKVDRSTLAPSFDFPKEWGKEKKMMAFINIEKHAKVCSSSSEELCIQPLGIFSTVPELIGMLGNIRDVKGKLHTIKITGANEFLLVALKEKGEEK